MANPWDEFAPAAADPWAEFKQAPKLVASHGAAPVYEPPQVGRAESGVRGALQGASLGFGDEAAAAVDAALPGFLRNSVSGEAVGQGKTYGERYQNARDYYRGRNATAEAANPGTYLAGQVAGAVAPSLVGAAPVTGGRALAVAAGQGAAQGAGYSDASSVRGLVGDAALGAALGTAGYGAGKVLGKGVSAAVRKGRDLVQSGTARAGVQAAGEVAEGIQSAAGKLGGEVQKGSRQVENLMRLEESMTPQQRALYDQLQQQGIVPNLQHAVAQSTLESLPSQAGTIAARQAELAALQQAAPQAVQSRASELLTPQVKADTKTFLKSYAEPMLWALGAQQAGDAMGLDPAQQGVLAGAAGVIGGRTRAGKALWTRLNRPAHQVAAGKLLERAATKTGKTLRPLLSAGTPAALTPYLLSTTEEN